jgi:hypothetical protein
MLRYLYFGWIRVPGGKVTVFLEHSILGTGTGMGGVGYIMPSHSDL